MCLCRRENSAACSDWCAAANVANEPQNRVTKTGTESFHLQIDSNCECLEEDKDES